MKKKTLLITHTDLDGISPIILMNLTGVKFEFKCSEVSEVEKVWNELAEESNNFEKYDQIYVTDLTLTQNIYDYINGYNLNVKVFDHHETHMFANEYPYVTVKVDINGVPTCGTELFYLYLKNLYKEELNKNSIKEYVDYVREIDTFRFTSDIPRQLDTLRSTYGTKDYIKTITRRLKNKDEFSFTGFEKRFTKLKAEEQQRYMEQKQEKMFVYNIDGHDVGVVFAERYKSDLGNYLAVNHPELEFIILIDASSRISYRAVRDDVNVAEFASIYRGGGHRLASGSSFSDDDRDKIVQAYYNHAIKKEIIEQ